MNDLVLRLYHVSEPGILTQLLYKTRLQVTCHDVVLERTVSTKGIWVNQNSLRKVVMYLLYRLFNECWGE